MNMPAANFSQNGLASIFGVKMDDDIQAPADNAHKRTAIIAGTICGIVVLAVLVGLGWYTACKKQYDEEQPLEKDVDPDVPREVVQPVELHAAALSELQAAALSELQAAALSELQAATLSELPVHDGPLPVRDG